MKIRKTKGNLSLLLLSIAILGLSFAVMAHSQTIFAKESQDIVDASEKVENHFIDIYDGDDKITIRSDATTVEDALNRAGIEISGGDVVEPALDTEIFDQDFNINIYRAHDVLVIDQGKKTLVSTAATTPEEVVKASGIKLLEADKVELVDYNNVLETGTLIAYQVQRAKTINFNFYGKDLTVRTQANTVAEFLDEQGIQITDKDSWLSLDKSTEIKDNLALELYKQGKQTVTQEETIAFEERINYDFDLDYGQERVTQTGQNGSKTVTYEIEMKNGQEVDRRVIEEVVTKQPVTQEKTVGRKVNLPSGSHEDWMAAAGISPADYGYVEFIISHESGWGYMKYNYSGSGAYGLCQALPGSKMASAGDDWQTNPITQLRWCNGYAVGRYGSWAGAYEFWMTHHWW